MAISPLFIERYILSELKWIESPDAPMEDRDYSSLEFEIETAVAKHDTQADSWRVGVRIYSKAESDMLSFAIAYTGFFKVADGYPAELAEKLVAVNGSSILYAASREMMLQISGRSLGGPFILPSVSFVDVPISKEQAEGAAKISTKKSPKPKAKSKPKRKTSK